MKTALIKRSVEKFNKLFLLIILSLYFAAPGYAEEQQWETEYKETYVEWKKAAHDLNLAREAKDASRIEKLQKELSAKYARLEEAKRSLGGDNYLTTKNRLETAGNMIFEERLEAIETARAAEVKARADAEKAARDQQIAAYATARGELDSIEGRIKSVQGNDETTALEKARQLEALEKERVAAQKKSGEARRPFEFLNIEENADFIDEVAAAKAKRDTAVKAEEAAQARAIAEAQKKADEAYRTAERARRASDVVVTAFEERMNKGERLTPGEQAELDEARKQRSEDR